MFYLCGMLPVWFGKQLKANVISLMRERVFGLESSRSTGDLSVTWLMPLAVYWVSLEGLITAQSQHRVLGNVIVGEFPLHGACSNPIAWLLFAKGLNRPKRSQVCSGSRHSSTQGSNSPAE